MSKLISSLIWFASVYASAAATTVWIDTDPAIGAPWREVDDAFALLLAFHSPELRIAGISTSYGNAPLSRTTVVAKDLMRRFGEDLKVNPGARFASDLGSPSEATDALARTLRNEHLTYVALAPLTNFASFATLHPDLLRHVDAIYFVGGQSHAGLLRVESSGWMGFHDTNVIRDPQAVSRVLATDVPITLAPAELGADLMITRDGMQQLAQCSSAGEFLQNRSLYWFAFWHYVAVRNGGSLFDCLPVLALAEPKLTRTRRAYANLEGIELRFDEAQGRAVKVVTEFDPFANAALLSRLTAIPPSR